jgi:uncharacterized protein (TIGR03067 family)
MVGPVLLFVIAGAFGFQDAGSDQVRIQGTWTLAESETGGEKIPPESLKARGVQMVFEEDRLIARMGDKTVTLGTFSLDPEKVPKTYDRVYNDGTKRLGIYRLEGDRLMICIAALDKERPTAFTTKPGDGVSLLVYIRERP